MQSLAATGSRTRDSRAGGHLHVRYQRGKVVDPLPRTDDVHVAVENLYGRVHRAVEDFNTSLKSIETMTELLTIRRGLSSIAASRPIPGCFAGPVPPLSPTIGFVSTTSTSFKVGHGGIRFLFLFVAVAGLPFSILMAIGGEWLVAAGMLAGGIFGALIYVWVPGILVLDESGLEIQRRRRSQRLRWADIDQVSWSKPLESGLAGLAIDNWVITLKGRRADGKETTVILSGPMVGRQHQKEVRQLFEARFPPPR